MNRKASPGLIIAIIIFMDGVVSPTAAPCEVTSPPCDLTIFDVPPTEYTITLDEPVNPATLDASDFTVNRIPAAAVVAMAGNTTVRFHFNRSPVVSGTNVMHIAAGAFNCASGQPVSE